MFEIGDYIICGKNGVCVVEKVGPMELPGVSNDILYYTLAPIYSPSSKVFTPVDNDKIVMRHIVTAKEAEKLIKSITKAKEYEVLEEKGRENAYKAIIMGCDCNEIISLVKMLVNRKKKCAEINKKLHSVDERYLKTAQDYLFGELACALEITRPELVDKINDNGGF